MNVIFLDIDGVMNSHVFFHKRHMKRWFKLRTYFWIIKKFFMKVLNIKHKAVSLANHITPDSYYEFEHQLKRLKTNTCKEKWSWLSEFCNNTDTKICISSVWKNHFGNKEGRIPDWWNDALIALGFNDNIYVGITKTRRTLRGTEIQEWLNEHPDVTNYAILDDDADMLPEQFVKFHHCDGWFGMSPNHLYRIQRQFEHGTNYENISKTIVENDL